MHEEMSNDQKVVVMETEMDFWSVESDSFPEFAIPCFCLARVIIFILSCILFYIDISSEHITCLSL